MCNNETSYGFNSTKATLLLCAIPVSLCSIINLLNPGAASVVNAVMVLTILITAAIIALKCFFHAFKDHYDHNQVYRPGLMVAVTIAFVGIFVLPIVFIILNFFTYIKYILVLTTALLVVEAASTTVVYTLNKLREKNDKHIKSKMSE